MPIGLSESSRLFPVVSGPRAESVLIPAGPGRLCRRSCRPGAPARVPGVPGRQHRGPHDRQLSLQMEGRMGVDHAVSSAGRGAGSWPPWWFPGGRARPGIIGGGQAEHGQARPEAGDADVIMASAGFPRLSVEAELVPGDAGQRLGRVQAAEGQLQDGRTDRRLSVSERRRAANAGGPTPGGPGGLAGASAGQPGRAAEPD